MVTAERMTGKYTSQLLLDILSDGIEWSARGFWAQIKQYKWYWWYVCEEGEPKYPNEISPDITDDTVLLQVRDDESVYTMYQFVNPFTDDGYAIEHRYDEGETTTFCGLEIPFTNTDDNIWDETCPESVLDKECPDCARWVDITLNKLAEATTWALENYNHLLNYSVHKGIVDDIDYDAIGADVIIQKVVLDSVIYG